LRLQKNCTTASASFDAARARFQKRIGICLKSEFLALTDELGRASDELKRARDALDVHIREHGCMV
jgi:hypothetical protein